MNQHQRLAIRVAGQIVRTPRQRAGPVHDSAKWPDSEWTSCRRTSRLLEIARQRGWRTAAARLEQRLQRELLNLRLQLDQLADASQADRVPAYPLQLRLLYEELLAPFEDYEQVEIDLKRRTVSVISDPIELDGIDLGRFEIRLKYAALQHAPRYEVIALEPNAAASNSSVTHPHVQDDRLCEGDGQAAIRSALSQGRLSDFFQIVVQILQTYNDSSPYVSLDDWTGEPCEDCGVTTRDDDGASCGYCEKLLCGQCQTCCSMCGDGCCDSCTDRCDGCEEFLCRSCQQSCSSCDDVFCENCLEETTCNTCRAAEAAKEEADETAAVEAELTPAAGETVTCGADTDTAVHAVCLGQTAVSAGSG